MAGGMGTRIAEVMSDVPKPMIPVAGKPVLEHIIRNLAEQQYREIILVIGYLGNVIREYFGDGTGFGVSLSYFTEEMPLGTAGALFEMVRQGVLEEDFFLINGDIILDVDFNRMYEYHCKKDALATIFAHPSNHPYDSAMLITDVEGRIIRWLCKEDERMICRNLINAGIHILSPEMLRHRQMFVKADLDRDVLKPAVPKGKIYAYRSPEYVRDMGTPERYRQVCIDYERGRIRTRNLHHKQKAVFLDRDGTINQYRGFIVKPEELTLLDGVAEAIAQINRSEYLAIVVTNQPVIARGECTPGELECIHARLETLLGAQGAWLDDIFYCPHHPDRGFEGECLEYKIDCICRKPKPGLILQAAAKYNIDLSSSYMVGDSESDVKAGIAAGCRSVYIGDAHISCEPVAVCNNLADFVQKYIGEDA